ncbi:DUF397 domain-containing protein [Streptomyces nitrosporeus]|uniref:DUF397 domain-containing protein n=1 Tax=Streptomyces nitrosporeus TaxID=28894 RepID=A0A5J6F8P9_9ACTN|nr:DUF397 domain-containing protein [Streptomyces nitrosporeus]QEU72869.1 DUF397 domain-containing protein [Streptomyces nitrosporeus]GGY74380.1 hypothetical protein GCM10010327_00030 [Streptomyces nitrosporeus]
MIRKTSVAESDGLVWFKSSYSDSSNGNDCVEVAAVPGAVHVRDSKNVPGPQLGFAPAAWAGFVAYASEG